MVGREVEKYFEGHGLFRGKVTSFAYSNGTGGLYTVRFEDGDHLDYYPDELSQLLIQERAHDVLVPPEVSTRLRPSSSARVVCGVCVRACVTVCVSGVRSAPAAVLAVSAGSPVTRMHPWDQSTVPETTRS